MSIRFVHIRPVLASMNVHANARFSDVGGTTIAYIYNDKKRQLHYGVARCSFKDKYSRPVGRRVASKRINTGGTVSYATVSPDGTKAPGYKDIAVYFNQLFGTLE